MGEVETINDKQRGLGVFCICKGRYRTNDIMEGAFLARAQETHGKVVDGHAFYANHTGSSTKRNCNFR